MKRLGIGLVGSGFMGRSHAHAFRAAPGVFDLPFTPVFEMLADINAEAAAKAAAALGFARSTGDWRELVADPAVDLVDITMPNTLHLPIALAAIEAGKPVYCEKPLAPNALDAKRMVDAAERKGVKTAVGFNYLKNPMVALAREIVESGEIGEVVSFRGIHAEDYMTDAKAPFTWRLDKSGGHGVVADLGSHIISIARMIVGPIDSLVGQIQTVTNKRPIAHGSSEMRAVEVDDEARALVRFASGATGSLEASWVKAGRKMTARLRGHRIEGHGRGRPRAAQRAPALHHRAVAGSRGLQDHPRRARPPVLQGIRSGGRPPARLQRHQDHRGDGAPQVARPGRAEVHARLPRGLGDPARRRRHRAVVQREALGRGDGSVGWAKVRSTVPTRPECG